MKNHKFQKLSLHHIDTSVILEPENTENGFYCKKYLNLVGYRYRGKFSFLVLGELLFDLLKLKSFSEQYDSLDTIVSLVNRRGIDFYSVVENEEVSTKIKMVDKRIDKTDRMIFASAVEDEANFFVTLDSKFVNNQNLEKEFGVKIKHPKDLIDL